jgi:hypothetical protein
MSHLLQGRALLRLILAFSEYAFVTESLKLDEPIGELSLVGQGGWCEAYGATSKSGVIFSDTAWGFSYIAPETGSTIHGRVNLLSCGSVPVLGGCDFVPSTREVSVTSANLCCRWGCSCKVHDGLVVLVPQPLRQLGLTQIRLRLSPR